MKYPHLTILAALLFCPALVWAEAALAPIRTDKASFEKAGKEAEKIEDDADAEQYRKDKLYPYFGPHYAKVMDDCFKSVAHPSMKSFSFIMALDSAGRVTEVDLEEATNVARCLVETVSVDRFPPPPFSPFVERMDMAVSKGAPKHQ